MTGVEPDDRYAGHPPERGQKHRHTTRAGEEEGTKIRRARAAFPVARRIVDQSKRVPRVTLGHGRQHPPLSPRLDVAGLVTLLLGTDIAGASIPLTSCRVRRTKATLTIRSLPARLSPRTTHCLVPSALPDPPRAKNFQLHDLLPPGSLAAFAPCLFANKF